MTSKASALRLVLDDEQRMLAKTALQFVEENAPVGRLRALRDEKDPVGFSRDLWNRMAELGWLGLQLPEKYGGVGLGFFELCIVLEAAGRHLMPEPFVSTLLLGSQALMLGGSEAQKKAWLPGIATGEKIVTVAFEERGSRSDPSKIQTKVSGSRLTGEKIHVLDGHLADAVIVSARAESGDVSLYLIDPKGPGVTVVRQTRVDTRNAAILRLEDVQVSDADLVGEAGEGEALLESVLDRARIGLSAEMLGASEQAFEDTLAYLKDRQQFGMPIGSFQSLQHRAARLFTEIALARSTVLGAARTVDDRPEDVPRMAALAKGKTSETFMHVAKEAIQMHGGIGMTDEHDIGFYIKRAQATWMSFGEPTQHRKRWAELNGY